VRLNAPAKTTFASPLSWTSPTGSSRSRSCTQAAARDAAVELSVTAIEDWLRDPYTIYAKHILRLDRSIPSDMRCRRPTAVGDP